MDAIKKILVPVDLSNSSELVFSTACQVATQLDANLIVMHAVIMSAVALPLEGQAVYSEEMIEELMIESKESLANFLTINNKTAIPITEYVCLGEPTIEINKYAEENGLDLIIMGTHGRTGLSHLLMGSVAEYVLRHSKIPVMSVPYNKI